MTKEEKLLIANYVTDVDDDVFGIVNLPDVVKGALFSRYSRSDKSLRQTLLDEFINMPESGFHEMQSGVNDFANLAAVQRAEDFYKRVLVGYGDDSIAELAGAHIACENISSLAADQLTDARIGISPLEKSARYIKMDRRYYIPEMEQTTKLEYIDHMNNLFNFYEAHFTDVHDVIAMNNPRECGQSESAWKRAVHAKTCDVMKNVLPASRLTNVGLYGNGRAYEYLISKLITHSSNSEFCKLGFKLHGVLENIMPAFVKRVQDVRYVRERLAHQNQSIPYHLPIGVYPTPNRVTFASAVKAEEQAITDICTASTYYNEQGTNFHRITDRTPRYLQDIVIDLLVGERKTRRDKLPRAFELVDVTLEIRSSYGAYRDFHRHRMTSQDRQRLKINEVVLPNEFYELGIDEIFVSIVESIEWLQARLPQHAFEYCVPRACEVNWYLHANLRELIYLIELRTGPQGHEEYRQIAQEMYALLERTYPRLMKHAMPDMNDYPLGRLSAEIRNEEKTRALEAT